MHSEARNEVPGTLPVDVSYQRQLQERVAFILNLSGNSGNRFPGAQPISFLDQHLGELTRQDYFVSEKADGVRFLLLMIVERNRQECFLIDRKNHYHFIPNLFFPLPNNFQLPHDNTILDGELVVDRLEDGREVRRFLIFDLLAIDGQSVIEKPFTSRLGRIKEFILKPFLDLQKQRAVPVTLPFTVEMKHTERSYALNVVLDQIIPKLKHGNDGLIFTSASAPYTIGTCEHMLKWKPPELNSIDFKIRVERDEQGQPHFILDIMRSQSDYQPYGELTVGANEPQYQLFMNDPRAVDGKIVECTYDPQWPTRWRFLRFREDKNTPNHISVVPKIMKSIEEGVAVQKLKDANYLQQVRALWKERESNARK